MKKLILITCLLIALLGMARNVVAAPSGYGSDDAGGIHLIDLGNGTIKSSFGTGIVFQGLAIDPNGKTLYGSTTGGDLYSIDINPGPTFGTTTFIGNMGIGTVEAMDFNGSELWVTDDDIYPTIYSIDTSDASNTFVVQGSPEQNDRVRAMTVNANSTKDVWLAIPGFPYNFESIDTVTSLVSLIGPLVESGSFPLGPAITGMDMASDGVLYGLAGPSSVVGSGGIYRINEGNGQLTPINDTNYGWLGLAAVDAAATTIEIALDIKPKHCPNILKIQGDDDSNSSDDGSGHKKKWKKKGKLKVAILGTETIHVRDIDIDTIRLNGVAPKKHRYKDLTCPTVLKPCDCEALDADTFEDLVLCFNKNAIVDTLEDVHNGDEILLTLTGKLTDEVTEIEGSDCVLIEVRGDDNSSDDCSGHKKKCKKKKHHSDDGSSGHKKKK